MTQSNTIFEQIIAGTIPSAKVYEDETSFAFLDIQPVRFGHTLLISKKPYPWMQEVPDQELAHLFVVAKKIMLAQKQAFGCDYVQLAVVGKDVPHFHIHLIPRMLSDNLHDATTLQYENPEAMHSIAQKIQQAYNV